MTGKRICRKHCWAVDVSDCADGGSTIARQCVVCGRREWAEIPAWVVAENGGADRVGNDIPRKGSES